MIGDRCTCGNMLSRVVLIARQLPFFFFYRLNPKQQMVVVFVKTSVIGCDLASMLDRNRRLPEIQTFSTSVVSIFLPQSMSIQEIGDWKIETGNSFDVRISEEKLVSLASGFHLFPFRTESLSPPAPMVLGPKTRESRSMPTQYNTTAPVTQ